MKFSGKKLNYKMFFVLAVIFVLFFVLVPSETAFSQVTPPSIEFRCCYSVRASPQQKICQDFHEDIGCQPPDWAEACPGVRSRCEDITNLPCYQAHCPEWTKPPIIPQKEETPQKETPFVPPKLQIPIPGLTLTTEESKLKICTECADPEIIDPAECPPEKCKNWAYRIPWIGEYLAALYKWAVGALAILAVVMIMINGVRWILAGGSPDKISEAKKGISSAIIGLVLVLLVHQILSLVDPRLTIFKPIVIGVIKRVEERIGSVGITPEERSNVEKYNSMGCPSEEEKKNGFSAFVTTYFEPTEEDFKNRKTYDYYKSFECMVAIECGCKGVRYLKSGEEGYIVCATVSGKDYGPCSKIETLEQFKKCCSGISASGKKLVPFYSLAADKKCFKFGTKIEITDSKGNKSTWEVMDVGGAIKGRHFDLFIDSPSGTNKIQTGVVTARVLSEPE
jgi:3D (Asp-Asp-Asp) domain-containing protein